MRISVLVPSYRRASDLDRCMSAIAGQHLAAAQVLVVARDGDLETFSVAKKWQSHLKLEIVEIAVPGVVQAMAAGLARCTGDVLAITDDDAAPRPDWLERIAAFFTQDARLGGVGGRDWIHQNGQVETGSCAGVGRILWYGRIIHNHHLGIGPARSVDVLKGVNSAFRMAALAPIGFEPRLHGQGAQVHWELCLCFAIKRAGWKLIYDPAIAVDHFPAQRFDRDGRNQFNSVATADRAYNFRLALKNVIPGWRRMTALLWYYLVGTRDEPGLGNFLRMLMKREPYALQRFRSAHGIGLGQR